MSRSTGVLVLALRAAAVLSALAAALWIIGPTAFGVVAVDTVPGSAQGYLLGGGAGQWNSIPSADVTLGDDAAAHTLNSAYDNVNGIPTSGALISPPRFGELLGATRVVLWDPSPGQRAAFVAIHVAALAGLAWLWWLLAALVASASTSPFTPRNTRRLRTIGGAVLLGVPVLAMAQWATVSWMVETSSVADLVERNLSINVIPWWAVGVGLVLMVLSKVWRDVEGLV